MIKLFSTLMIVAGLIFTYPGHGMATETAPEPPPCNTDGDMDADGISDDEDVDETDSCQASSTGVEDCETGAGDGVPDCTDNS